MKINGNEIRPGNIIQYRGEQLWVAVKTQAVKPGKGGAFAQVELKNIVDGTKLNERFRASETVERVRLEQRKYTYLYPEGDMLVFMDAETYEQIELQLEFVGEDRAALLQDNMVVEIESFEGKHLGLNLPNHISVTIAEADAVVKGQTASSSYKPAVLDSGVKVMVPQFIASGEQIIIDSAELTYVKRASS